MNKTTTASKRGLKGTRTYNELLEHAAVLFAKHGYDGVSLQQITESAGVTKGSLYYHFKGKQHVYAACVEYVVATTYEKVKSPVLKGTADEQLDQYINWILRVMKSNSLARRLLLHIIIDHDVVLMKQLMKGPMGISLEMFTSILKQKKLKKDTAVLSYFFYAICMLNHELLPFTGIWLPSLNSKVGGIKAAGYLKSLIQSW